MRHRIFLAFFSILIPALTFGALAPADEGSIKTVGPSDQLILPKPLATPAATNRSRVVGWPQNLTPKPLPGFRVTAFGENFASPRQIYVLPNGDVLVAENGNGATRSSAKSAGRITLLRDANHDGKPEVQETFLSGLTLPFGMLALGDHFYVGNTDGIYRYSYRAGQTQLSGPAEKILDLPTGGHYTRNLIANADGSKIFVAVGSSSNVDENGNDAKDPRRAAILEINPDGSGMKVYAGGLRNPVGLGWAPGTSILWCVVNERDNLGDDLVPDYLTSVKEGAFYGWPYSYFGHNVDPRKKGERPDLVAKAIPPDYALGTHIAPLGLAFYTSNSFPQQYRGGAFVGEHGSWNRSILSGYKVVFIPFEQGKPAGMPQDFLTGFIADEAQSKVYGRPAGVAVAADGSLLVADDEGNRVWLVQREK